ncbi:MAG: hypothetical protein PUF17_01395 [Lactimicrobium massiliense]|nr:hypothetical protein [Lactimicrobium massiliense]MDD6559608.1 hypothetical protein [Lactimicrobium massiliense]
MSEQYANRQEKGQLRRLRNIQVHIFYVCGQYVMLEDDLVLVLALKTLAENALASPGFWMNRP